MSPPVGYQLRRASIEDAPEILAIYQKSDPYALSTHLHSGITLLDVMDWLDASSDSRPMLVMIDDHDLIAWCSIEPFYGLPAFDGAVEISVYVLPEFQGKGIGSVFLRYLEEHQDALGFHHLVAYVFASNNAGRRFFLNNRFEQWGFLPNIAQHNGQGESVYIYGREYRF